MKVSDLFTLRAPNRFHKQWEARLTDTQITASASSSDAAIIAVVEQVKRAAERQSITYRFADDGTLFCLYFMYDCWCYDIVHKDTPTTPSSCHMSAITYTQALAQMEDHVMQYGH